MRSGYLARGELMLDAGAPSLLGTITGFLGGVEEKSARATAWRQVSSIVEEAVSCNGDISKNNVLVGRYKCFG